MKFVCALITVSDIQQSRSFYEDVLEQKVKYDFGESITFEGDFTIHLRSHYQKLIENKEVVPGINNFELYFESEDIELIAKRLREYGAVFVHAIREQPWRQKVVRFYDPDRNIIEVGEPLEALFIRLHNEGMKVEDIADKVGVSIGFVKDSMSSGKHS